MFLFALLIYAAPHVFMIRQMAADDRAGEKYTSRPGGPRRGV